MKIARWTCAALTVLVAGWSSGCTSGGGSGASGSVASTAPGSTASGSPSGTTAPGSTTPPPVSSPTVASPAPSPSPSAAPQGLWLKGDFHVHSTHSGDASWGDDVTGVIRCAEYAGLDFTTLSDHRTAAVVTDPEFTGAQTSLVLIAGEEWGQPGHAGAHGLTRDPVTHTQDETQGPAVAVQKIQAAIDDVHSMGGIFVLNHAIDSSSPWYWPVDRFDAVEVWNQPWCVRSATDVTPAEMQAWAAAHGLGQPGAPQVPSEVSSALSWTGGGQNWQRLHLYEAFLGSGHRIAAVGGSDAHYVFLPGSPTTVVFAASRSKDAILEGVRQGRTMVQRAPDAPALEFTADVDGQGTFASFVGDTLPAGHPVTLRIHVKDDLAGKVQLVKSGTVVQEWPVTSSDFTVTYQETPAAAAWYRVNVLEPLDPTLPHADLLKALSLGQASLSPILQTLASSSFLGSSGQKIMSALNSGVPAVAWMLLYGSQAGITVAPVPTAFPRLVIPAPVSRYLNLAVHDQDYGMGVVTSPIWVK